MLISETETVKGGERLLSKPRAFVGARQSSFVSQEALSHLLVEGFCLAYVLVFVLIKFYDTGSIFVLKLLSATTSGCVFHSFSVYGSPVC